MRPILTLVVFVAMQGVWAQTAISARSGLVHHVEGNATISGTRLDSGPGKFKEVREGNVLQTNDGRAEVLLNPGAFLRIDGKSSFKMLSSKLDDTRIELLRGTALIEVEELAKDNHLAVVVGDATVVPLKHGLYALDAEGRTLRVYDGKATASLGSTSLQLGRGRVASLAPVLEVSKFDRHSTDNLYAWSARRAGLLAQANQHVSLASAMSGQRGRLSSAWVWYPDLGFYTFLPGSGRIYSPFGWYFFSPVAMWQIYNPAPPIRGYGAPASAGGWAERPSYSGGSAPAAVAAQSGSVGRSAPAAAPASAGGGRSR